MMRQPFQINDLRPLAFGSVQNMCFGRAGSTAKYDELQLLRD